jgi:hypothetical protein
MKKKVKKQLKRMDPRAIFAAHALTGLLAAHKLGYLGAGQTLEKEIKGYCTASWAMANAMMEEKILEDAVEASYDEEMKMTVDEVDAYWDKFFAIRPALSAAREGAVA